MTVVPLRLVQKRFAQALLDRDRDPPQGLTGGPRRFAVYRNNVFVTLTDALGARFPVVRRLVGEDFFHAMARVFIELSPPRSPLLMRWGDELPAFLELFPPARPVPCLADVARLERAASRAYHAADAEPLDATALATLPPGAWEAARVALHPSVAVVASPHPIVSIWEAHRDAEPRPVAAGAEEALVARPRMEVEVRRLPPAGAAFIRALMRHGSLQAAVEGALAQEPRFDVVGCLTALIAGRTFVALTVDEAEVTSARLSPKT
jgi:hypothetical protein